MSSFRPKLGLPGAYIFHWAKLHPTELHCILLSYAAPFGAPHLQSYAAPFGSTLHTSKLCCIQLSYAAPNLSHDAPYLSYTLP